MVSACHIQRKQFYQTSALESYHRNDGGGDVGKIGTAWQERKQVFADIPYPHPREINTLWTISELTTKQNRTPQTTTWILRQSPFSYSPLWQRLRSTTALEVHGCGHGSLSSVSRVDGVSAEQGLRAPWPFPSQLTLSNTTLFWLPRQEESVPRGELRLFRTTLQRQKLWGSSAWRVCFPVSGHSEGLRLGMLSWEAWTHGFPLNSGFQEKGNVWERNCLAGTCLVFWDGKGVREDQVIQAHCACWGCSGKTRRRRKRVPSKAASFP